MVGQVLEVVWDRVRPGVTVVRSDGRHERAAIVDRANGTVVVIFDDGLRERHAPDEPACIALRDA